MAQARKLSRFNLVLGVCMLLALVAATWSTVEDLRYRGVAEAYITELEREVYDLRASVGATTSELQEVRQQLESAGAELDAANAEVVRLQGEIAGPECAAASSRWCTATLP